MWVKEEREATTGLCLSRPSVVRSWGLGGRPLSREIPSRSTEQFLLLTEDTSTFRCSLVFVRKYSRFRSEGETRARRSKSHFCGGLRRKTECFLRGWCAPMAAL